MTPAANDNRIITPLSAYDLACPRCKAYPGQHCRLELDQAANWRRNGNGYHDHHRERIEELYAKGDALAGLVIARAIFERRSRT